MRGAALREDQFVDVGRLFSFAADQVPQLATGSGGIQRPIVAMPRGGASFDIGRLTSQLRGQVPLQPVLPLVLRATFQDERRFRDQLDLGRSVNDQLRAASMRGTPAALVFVDADDFPGACELVGRYSIIGEEVAVNVLLALGNKDVARFTLEGQRQAVDELAEEIVFRATQELRNPREPIEQPEIVK